MAKLSAKNPVVSNNKKQAEIINKSKVEKPNKAKKAVKTNDVKVVTAPAVQNKENADSSATTYLKQQSVQANIPDKEFTEKYPIFKNVVLVNKFLSLRLTNNQKGRLRQEVRDTVKGTSPQILPDVIYDMVKAVGKGKDEYTEGQLRKIRILYNMLRTAIQNKNNPEKVENDKAKGKENGVSQKNGDKKVGKKNKKLNGVEENAQTLKVDNKNKKLKGKENGVNVEESIKKVGKNNKLNAVGDDESEKNKKNKKLKVEENEDSDEENADSDEKNDFSDEDEDNDEENEDSGENDEEMDTGDDEELSPKPVKKGKDTNTKADGKKGKDVKVKEPKRYVVFVGNLPLDTDKEKIMKHFSNLKDQIVDIRVPPPAEGKKSTIAYVELKNSTSYELALSKHHTMMANRRINVLFSTQKNSKLTDAEAKGKAAKLAALQASGMLTGSAPLAKKRSQRRKKAKQAQKKLENNE